MLLSGLVPARWGNEEVLISTISFSQTRRSPKRWVFCFHRGGPQHNHTTETMKTAAATTTNRTRTRAFTHGEIAQQACNRELVAMLTFVYFGAGLPMPAASRAAHADLGAFYDEGSGGGEP